MKVILVGGGKTLFFLCRRFAAKGYQVVVVNRDREECVQLSRQLSALVVHGDGSDAEVLKEAGAMEADALLAITPNDQDNLIICQLAAVVGVLRVMAVRAVAVLVLAVGPVLVLMAVSMAVHVAVFVGMGGPVLVGVFVHVAVLVLMLVLVRVLAAVGVPVGHLVLAEIATAVLAHGVAPLGLNNIPQGIVWNLFPRETTPARK